MAFGAIFPTEEGADQIVFFGLDLIKSGALTSGLCKHPEK